MRDGQFELDDFHLAYNFLLANDLAGISVNSKPADVVDSNQRQQLVNVANEHIQSQYLGKSVKCETLAQYHIVRGVFLTLGGVIWPWHEGYKDPTADIHDCPYYGWEPAGFLKHIMKPAEEDIIPFDEFVTRVLITDKVVTS